MADTRDYVNQSGLSRAAIFSQVDASLARLGTDYIDLLQIHRADLENASAEETMKALHDLVQTGKVRYLGASSMWTWQLQHYNHVAEVCPLSLLAALGGFCLPYDSEMDGRLSSRCKINTTLCEPLQDCGPCSLVMVHMQVPRGGARDDPIL